MMCKWLIEVRAETTTSVLRLGGRRSGARHALCAVSEAMQSALGRFLGL